MKKRCVTRVAILLCAGASLFQGCPIDSLISGVLSDCYGEGTISAADYDDLNDLEQLFYEENDCGRYERREF